MTAIACRRNSFQISGGFTLVEMMVVVAIIAILGALAVPSFNDLIAEQRVRGAASELISEINYARAEAIKQHRRVVVEHLGAGTSWTGGLRIFVDVNGDNTFNAGETTLRTVTGFGANTTKICPLSPDFDLRIVFRGDGTVSNAVLGTESGLRIADDQGKGADYLRSRNVVLSPAGRASVQILARGAGGLVSC